MVYELYRRRLLNNKAVSFAELLGIIVRTLIKESGFGVTLPMFNTDTVLVWYSMVLFVFCSRKISVLNVVLNAPQNFFFWLMTSVLASDFLGRAA